MSSEWKLLKLETVAEIIGGGTPKTSNQSYWGGYIPWITPKDLSNFHERYVRGGSRNITQNGLSNSSAKMLPKGTVLLTSRAPIGYVAIASNPIATNQGFKSLVLKKGYCPLFFYYLLKHNKEKLESFSSGSTFKEISGNTLKKIEFIIPSYETQKQISHILGCIDDKIELNRQMCQTLEAIASTLFKSWFVDFDPVKAKATGRQPEGLSPEIAALFPDSFVDSPLGKIPKGWNIVAFGKLLSKTIGGDWGTEVQNDKYSEKVTVLRGTDIPKIKNLTSCNIPTRFIQSCSLEKKELKNGDIIIEISGGTKNQPTGRSAYISKNLLDWFENPVIAASFCRLFRPISLKYSFFLSSYLNYIYDQGKTWSYQNQSTGISNFQTTVFLENELLPIPSTELLNAFHSIINPIIEKIYSKENIILNQIRDIILPKLISGEIKIQDTKILNQATL